MKATSSSSVDGEEMGKKASVFEGLCKYKERSSRDEVKRDRLHNTAWPHLEGNLYDSSSRCAWPSCAY